MADVELSQVRDIQDQLGRDLMLASAHIVARAHQIRSAATLMADATGELGRGSDEATVREAVEAVNATATRLMTLALECTGEAGRLLGVSFANDRLNEIE